MNKIIYFATKYKFFTSLGFLCLLSLVYIFAINTKATVVVAQTDVATESSDTPSRSISACTGGQVLTLKTTGLECANAFAGITDETVVLASYDCAANQYINAIVATSPICSSFPVCGSASTPAAKDWYVTSTNKGFLCVKRVLVEETVEVSGVDQKHATLAADFAALRASKFVADAGYFYSSDIRLKDNIKKIQNPLDILKRLNGYTYNWKSSGERAIGVIAQEVEKVLPELIFETGTDRLKSVNYDALIPVLIESIKEIKVSLDQKKQLLEKKDRRIHELENLLGL